MQYLHLIWVLPVLAVLVTLAVIVGLILLGFALLILGGFLYIVFVLPFQAMF